MNVLAIGFADFKKLALQGEKRVYIYEGSDFIDFHMVHESIITKSRLMKTDIEDFKTFFSNRMFMGAITLGLNVPLPNQNLYDKGGLDSQYVRIEDVQDEETKQTDYQKEGVE